MPINNIDIFDSYYMAGMVREIIPQQTFFKDRYFPTGTTDIFAAQKVLVEYEDGDRAMAPFVVKRAGDIPVARGGYEVHEFEPPYIAPSRLLTMDDLEQRGFGEAILSESTEEERAAALQIKDLTDLDKRIQRREEWMAVQTMINNGCTMVAYIDRDTQGETHDVFYYDTAGSNPALYTVSDQWDTAQGDFWSDVEAMAADLHDRGLPAADLIIGPDVAATITDDEKLGKLLDNRRMEYGGIAPKILYPGVSNLGRLNFGGFELEIYVVRESYVGTSGRTERYFPSNAAMVTAPGCGHMMYGQVTQLEPDKQYHSFAMPRVPKFVVNEDKDTRKLRLASRPLAAPLQKAPWIYAPNVVTSLEG